MIDRMGRMRFAPRVGVAAAVVALSVVAAAGTAGADQSVAISNFSYQPAAVTVPPGTKVTWTNMDNAPHSVTADGGSFDSSPGCSPTTTAPCLAHGATFSHTFATAGTFAYHCSVHAFMHGTVVVTGSSGSSGSTTTSTSAAAPATATPGAAAARASTATRLPRTGTRVAPLTVLGLVLVALGGILGVTARRRSPRRRW